MYRATARSAAERPDREASQQANGASAPARPGGRLRRVLLASAITVVSINVWTGAPVLALWIAARVEHGMFPTLAYIGLVAVLLGVISFVLLRLLALLGEAYERSLGRERRVRQHVPWLRSMRDERRSYAGVRHPVSAVDRTMVIGVTVCMIAFEIWFFFFAHQTLVGGGAL